MRVSRVRACGGGRRACRRACGRVFSCPALAGGLSGWWLVPLWLPLARHWLLTTWPFVAPRQLEAAIDTVARALKDYLVKEARVRPASSEHPSTTGVPIYITKPFCFEEGRNGFCSKSCCRGFARSRACISLVSSGIRQPIVRSRQRRQINTSMSVECTCWLRACVVFALLCHQKFLVAMSSRQHQVA